MLHICYTLDMPTTQPRISTVVEKPLFDAIRRLAKHDGVSISEKTRSLLLEALELEEDAALESIVMQRKRLAGKFIALDQVKNRLKIK